MKKIIAILLASMMMLSTAACGNTTDSDSTDTTTAAQAQDATNADTATDGTVGSALLADFKANPNGTAQEIADRLLQNKVCQFMGGSMPVEEGPLTGFDNAEIKGFKEGVMFSPMVGTIPFVGYIFQLEDGADVEAFKTTLKDSANLRWNICTEAEELIVENEGNTVFFLMCPKNFDQPEDNAGDMGGDMSADMEIPAEEGIPAYDGEDTLTEKEITLE